jgi:hypothetical protein
MGADARMVKDGAIQNYFGYQKEEQVKTAVLILIAERLYEMKELAISGRRTKSIQSANLLARRRNIPAMGFSVFY